MGKVGRTRPRLTAHAVSCLRTIRGSLSRFFAIVGIVALGCGFFAGLQMCGPDMRAAADELFDGTNLYDIRVISSMGLAEADVSRLRAIPGVEDAMPAITADVLCRVGTSSVACRFSTLDVDAASSSEESGATGILSGDGHYLNRVFLREGRWPRAVGECVVAADNPTMQVACGDTVEVLYGADDVSGMLKEQTLICVGTVSSSAYPYTGSFGSTTLGSGSIELYLYVTRETFSDDAPFTEAYLTVQGADEYESASVAYEACVGEVTSAIEDKADELAERRLQDLTAEARAEVESGTAELASARQEAEARFAEADAELAAASEQLAQSRPEVEQGRARVDRMHAEAEGHLDDLRNRLSAAEANLASLEATVSGLEADLAQRERDLIAWSAALGVEAQDLPAARAGLSGLATSLAWREARTTSRPVLEAAIEEGERLVADLEVRAAEEGVLQEAYQVALDRAREELQHARDELAELEAADSASPEVQLSEVNSAIAQIDAVLGDATVLVARKTELTAAREAADTLRTAVTSAEQSSASTLSSADAQIRDAERQLAQGQADYDAGVKQLAEERERANERFADAERQLADARTRIDEVARPEIYVLDRTKNEGTLTYDADSRRMDSIASVFPVMFFLVAALVALTTMTRMVEDERTEIGTYKALGYTTAQIASKYLVYAGAASALGAALGIAVLAQVLPYVVTASYSIIYTVPLMPFPLPVDPLVALASGGLGVGVTLAATLAAVVACLKEAPATLMRPRPPAAGRRILLERVGFVWRRLSFTWKVCCRNLFRYKRRLAMTVFGISGCTALLLVGYGVSDAVGDIIAGQYGPIQHFDVTVGLDDTATEIDAAAEQDFFEERYPEGFVCRVQDETMQAGTRDVDETLAVHVVVPRDAGEFERAMTLRERGGPDLVLSDDAVIVTEKISLKYGVRIGDELLLFEQDRIGNAFGTPAALTVTGICENYVGNAVYLGRGAWAQVSDATPAYTCLYVRTDADEEGRVALSRELRDHSRVSTVVFTAETVETYSNMLSVVDVVIYVLIVAAGLLAFIVLYNLTNINVGERVREIASLKVLGFTRREVYAYIFREIALLSIAGDALGLVLGTYLATFVITTAEVDYVMFGRSIHPTSYVWSFALTLVFTALVLLLMRRRLDGVDMVESLKSHE